MKTATDLCALVIRFVAMPSEPEWLEFKGNNKDPEKIGELVSGLANSAALHRQERAYIVWGIDDATHAIVGTTFRPRQMKVSGQDLEHFLATQLTPHTNIAVHDNLVINSKVVVAFEIEPARTAPIAFRGQELIRICSHNKSLKKFIAKERDLWKSFETASFESAVAMHGLAEKAIESLSLV